MPLRSVFLRLLLISALSLPAGLAAQAVLPPPQPNPRIDRLISQLEKVRPFYQVALSPDGAWIAWAAGAKDGDREGSMIELAPASRPDERRLITAGAHGELCNEGSLAWSPDSKHLAFLSDCGAPEKTGGNFDTSLYTVSPPGTAAPRRLTRLHGYAKALAWSPDGRRIGFLYVEGATRPSGATAAMKPFSGVIGIAGLEVQRVAAADATTGALRQITPPTLHVYEFDWSPDSRQLAYVAAPPPGEDNWWVAKLYTQTAAPGEGAAPRAIFDPAASPGELHGLQIAVPRWSPGGDRIAFIGGLMSDQGSTGSQVYAVPAGGGAAQKLLGDPLPLTVRWIQWIGPSRLLFTAIRGGSVLAARADVPPAGDPAAKPPSTMETLLEAPGSFSDGRLASSLSVSRDLGRIAFIESSFSQPPEVYTGTFSKVHAITRINRELKPSWGKAESITWRNGGFDVQGWLLLPANYDPAKKYPMIVYVHGGPSAAVTPDWPGAGYGPVPFSALGYFVLMANPRGSFGQGERFTEANRKDFGYGDLRDILAGVDAVEKKYPVDDHRLGITGWSYGGFMTMFAVTQTHRFHAAVAGAGIANWQSYYGQNSISEWMIPFFGASVYDNPAVYARSSAINFIRQANTPTLLVVGDRDGECPAPQSFEFWRALRAQHVPTELVVYPNEGHVFAQPDHRRDVLKRSLAWLERYLPEGN